MPGALIVNSAGKVLMFSVDITEGLTDGDATTRRAVGGGHAPSHVGGEDSACVFAAPVLLATGVEAYWVPYRVGCAERHLIEALWLACGGTGMKVCVCVCVCEGVSVRECEGAHVLTHSLSGVAPSLQQDARRRWHGPVVWRQLQRRQPYRRRRSKHGQIPGKAHHVALCT
jgi:hypothetical protein